ncbi:MAG: hypothetical protein JW395_1288 [Nitrospira sp.]|nr:hypothetical protein [Nitrospira sp.]
MSTSATPNGLIPINKVGGSPNNGALRLIKIASGYAANVFSGDVVKIVTAGTIEKDTGTATATPCGVFAGCTFTDPNSNTKVFKQYWPTGTVAADAMAYVVDDPNQLFQIQGSATVAQAALGANAALVQGSGSTTTGVSAVSLDASSVATTATLPLRIVDFVVGPSSAVGDTYTDCIVKFNTHAYVTTTGV